MYTKADLKRAVYTIATNPFHTGPQGSTFHHVSVPTPSSLLLFTLEQVWEKLTMNGFIHPFSSYPLIYLHSQQEMKSLNAVWRFLRNVDCHSSKITTTNIYGLYSGGMQLNRIEFFLLLKNISAAGFEASPWASPACLCRLTACFQELLGPAMLKAPFSFWILCLCSFDPPSYGPATHYLFFTDHDPDPNLNVSGSIGWSTHLTILTFLRVFTKRYLF